MAEQELRASYVSLTLRNWFIGGHIHHYELHGNDRAQYGDRLMDSLAGELKRHRVATCDRQRLYAYLAFFRTYPQIGAAVQRGATLTGLPSIVRSLTGQLIQTDETEIVRSPTGQFDLPGQTLLDRLSYTHLELLTALDDPLKRAIYEIGSNPPVGLLLCTQKDHALVECDARRRKAGLTAQRTVSGAAERACGEHVEDRRSRPDLTSGRHHGTPIHRGDPERMRRRGRRGRRQGARKRTRRLVCLRSERRLVGAAGFEPATLCSQSKCATRLRHAPNRMADCRLRSADCPAFARPPRPFLRLIRQAKLTKTARRDRVQMRVAVHEDAIDPPGAGRDARAHERQPRPRGLAQAHGFVGRRPVKGYANRQLIHVEPKGPLRFLPVASLRQKPRLQLGDRQHTDGQPVVAILPQRINFVGARFPETDPFAPECEQDQREVAFPFANPTRTQGRRGLPR